MRERENGCALAIGAGTPGCFEAKLDFQLRNEHGGVMVRKLCPGWAAVLFKESHART